MGDFIINGKTVASLQIVGKEVIRIADGQTVLWEKTSPQPVSDYLCFTANEANCTVGMTHNGTNQTTTQPVMYYSTDQTNWTLWDYSTITLANAGDKVYFYGNNPNGFSTSSSNYSKFTTSGSVACSGNIMTLITRDGSETTIPSSYCFYRLFFNCTSLTTAPELPATTLASNCYQSTFDGCTSLTTAPELPATTLADRCYFGMFYYCISMTTAPELPATTLADSCYDSMFGNCQSLTTAPELSATTLAQNCYSGMFYGCSQLNYIKVGATTWNASWAAIWVMDVAATGTFVKPVDLVIGTGTGEIPLNATNGIPSGWTVQNTNDYLCFTAEAANSSFTLDNHSTAPVIYWSTDKTNWTLWDYSTITLQNVGDKVYFYGENPNGISSNNGAYSRFSINGNTSGRIAASGDIMSLIDRTCPKTIPNDGCFWQLFKNFTALTEAPSLGATTLTQSCYFGMFYGCTNLTVVPTILPATTVPAYAYQQMFIACENITSAPQLPATTLSYGCYSQMFNGCTRLVQAPNLPATVVPQYAYNSMFERCSALNSVTCLATDISASMCTNNWLMNVSSTGTFTKNPQMSSWTTGSGGIPTGWTVQDYQ